MVKVPKKLHSRSKKPVETSTNPNYQNTRIPIITYTMTIPYGISIHINSYEQGLSNDMTKNQNREPNDEVSISTSRQKHFRNCLVKFWTMSL